MSGLCAAIQLQKKLGISSFTLFEKNADVGGTWLNNVYPGNLYLKNEFYESLESNLIEKYFIEQYK